MEAVKCLAFQWVISNVNELLRNEVNKNGVHVKEEAPLSLCLYLTHTKSSRHQYNRKWQYWHWILTSGSAQCAHVGAHRRCIQNVKKEKKIRKEERLKLKCQKCSLMVCYNPHKDTSHTHSCREKHPHKYRKQNETQITIIKALPDRHTQYKHNTNTTIMCHCVCGRSGGAIQTQTEIQTQA